MTAPTCLDVEYRPIPGFHAYSVSAAGEIVGPRGPRKVQVDRNGHHYIQVGRRWRVPGMPRVLFIHRAVLLAWVGPCPPGEESLHDNGQPDDNRLENLHWGSRAENIADRARHGDQVEGERVGTAKLTAEQVAELRALRGTVSLRELGRRYGVSHVAVLAAMNGTTWRCVP